jgi:hypothetical protein
MVGLVSQILEPPGGMVVPFRSQPLPGVPTRSTALSDQELPRWGYRGHLRGSRAMISRYAPDSLGCGLKDWTYVWVLFGSGMSLTLAKASACVCLRVRVRGHALGQLGGCTLRLIGVLLRCPQPRSDV